MSTRSVILVDSIIDEYDWETKKSTSERRPVARFYRHCDGYPDGHGADILYALAEASMDSGQNNRNWAQHFLAHYLAKDMDVEAEVPQGEGSYCHGDLEYVYRVCGGSDYTGGKESTDSIDQVEVTVYPLHFDDDVDENYSNLPEPMFKGSWRDMAKWMREYCLEHYSNHEPFMDTPYGDSWQSKGTSPEAWKTVQVASRA